jgi:hypothetical protein
VRLISAVLASILVCASAEAADKSGHFQTLGAGALACSKYLAADGQDKLFVETWWAGYMTAMNRSVDDTWSFEGKNSADDVNAMLREECAGDPQELIGNAVHAVLEKLYPDRRQAGPGD